MPGASFRLVGCTLLRLQRLLRALVLRGCLPRLHFFISVILCFLLFFELLLSFQAFEFAPLAAIVAQAEANQGQNDDEASDDGDQQDLVGQHEVVTGIVPRLLLFKCLEFGTCIDNGAEARTCRLIGQSARLETHKCLT